jgi:hypothetical protein
MAPAPIDPGAMVHYLAACKVAGVPVAQLDVLDLRALIDQCSRLSIPDAARVLRARKACIWGRCNGTIGSDGHCNRCGSKRP